MNTLKDLNSQNFKKQESAYTHYVVNGPDKNLNVLLSTFVIESLPTSI